MQGRLQSLPWQWHIFKKKRNHLGPPSLYWKLQLGALGFVGRQPDKTNKRDVTKSILKVIVCCPDY
jgi:hypothetical protein